MGTKVSSRWKRMPDAAVATAIFAALLVAYWANGDFYPIEDAVPSVLLTDSLLDDGDLAFRADEIPDTVIWTLHADAKDTGRRVRLSVVDERIAALQDEGLLVAGRDACDGGRCVPAAIDGLYVNTFMPGSGLTAFAPLAGVRAVYGRLSEHPAALWYGGKLAASLCVAASAALVYLTAVVFVPRAYAVLIAVAYGLGTCVWVVSSQALWQHGPTELYLALGTFALVRIPRGVGYAALCGAAYGAATWCRPTAAAVVVSVGVYLLMRERRALWAYVLAGLPLALGMMAYNAHYFGSPLEFGQTQLHAVALEKTGSPEIWATPLWYGLPAVLLSPSRGLLAFSPFLLAAFWGAWRAWRDPAYVVLRPLSVAVLAMWCIEAQHFDWWGGWSFGYRHIVDTVTLLAVLLVPVMDEVLRRRWYRRMFVAALGWSVAVQLAGAVGFNLSGWNARPAFLVVLPDRPEPLLLFDEDDLRQYEADGGASIRGIALNVDRPEHRHRLWSLSDNQMVYYLTHFAEARADKRDKMRYALRGMPARRAESYGKVGEAFFELRRFRKAVDWFRNALEIDPQQAEARRLLALALALDGRLDEALERAQRMAADEPTNHRLLNRLGLMLLLDGQVVEAADRFDAAYRAAGIGAVGDSEYVFQRWETLAAEAPQVEKTIGYVESMQAIKLMRELLYRLREGRHAMEIGDLDEAEAHFRKATERCPQWAGAYIDLGKVQLAAGRYQEASRSFRRAIELRPNDADAYDNLGVSVYYEGRRREARDLFAKAVRLDPQHSWAARHLRAVQRKLKALGQSTENHGHGEHGNREQHDERDGHRGQDKPLGGHDRQDGHGGQSGSSGRGRSDVHDGQDGGQNNDPHDQHR